MVIAGIVIGIRLLEIIKPPKMLPNSKRLIGLISEGLFSLIKITGGNRGCSRRAKKHDSSTINGGQGCSN